MSTRTRLANEAPMGRLLLPNFALLSLRTAASTPTNVHTHGSLRLSFKHGTSIGVRTAGGGAGSSRDDADDEQPRKGGMPKLTVREPAQLIDPVNFDPMASGFGYSELRDDLWEVIYIFKAMAPSDDDDESA